VGAKDANFAGEKESQLDRLLRLGESADLFHAPDGELYAVFPVNGHRETWRIKDRAFKYWLVHSFFRETGRGPNAQPLRDAIEVFECKARYDGQEQQVHIRVAGDDDVIYLDLANEAWQVVEVRDAGWRIINDSPVRFRRPDGMLALPVPQAGGKVQDLLQFVNVTDKSDGRLVVAWMHANFRPKGPYPILALHGEHGSAKTTTQEVLRYVIDPNVAPLRAEPKDQRDLAIAAGNSWMIGLDNLSYIKPWLSDNLCRLATGGGFGTRGLWTDDSEKLFYSQRPIMLNGIEELASKPDLLDTSIVLYLLHIPEQQRKPKSEFWAEFKLAHPRLLGAFLDAAAAALKKLKTVRLGCYPRMADFAHWVTAAETELGWSKGEFMAAYAGNRVDANSIALESSPLTLPVRGLVENGCFQGTATALLKRLAEQLDEPSKVPDGWPKNPRALSGKLRHLAPNLRANGIEVKFQKSGQRLIEVRKFASAASTGGAGAPPLQDQSGATGRIPDCPWCGGTERWSLPDGAPVCAHCHPNPDDCQGEGSAESKSWTQ
jgi:hypothetical protein